MFHCHGSCSTGQHRPLRDVCHLHSDGWRNLDASWQSSLLRNGSWMQSLQKLSKRDCINAPEFAGSNIILEVVKNAHVQIPPILIKCSNMVPTLFQKWNSRTFQGLNEDKITFFKHYCIVIWCIVNALFCAEITCHTLNCNIRHVENTDHRISSERFDDEIIESP